MTLDVLPFQIIFKFMSAKTVLNKTSITLINDVFVYIKINRRSIKMNNNI